jgi:hypothetical protein
MGARHTRRSAVILDSRRHKVIGNAISRASAPAHWGGVGFLRAGRHMLFLRSQGPSGVIFPRMVAVTA